jgi:protein-arginine deiminase
MKRALLCFLMLSACKPASKFLSDVFAVPLAPEVKLLADANRNGTLDWDDATENTDKTTWNASHGAVMLANIDDDQRVCVATKANGDLLDDTALDDCNDGADTIINGDNDKLDLAPLAVREWPFAPDGTTATLRIDNAAATKVHLFIERNGALVWFNPLTDVISTGELRAGVKLAIEATDIVRDTTVWDGFVTVTLSCYGLTDAVKLRVAPVITQHHLSHERQMYVGTFAGDEGSDATVNTLMNGIDTAWGTGASTTMLTEIDADQSFNGNYYYEDQWTQDFFETAYMAMPTANGTHVIDVFYRSANVYNPSSSTNPLRDAGKVTFAQFRGPDAAAVMAYDIQHSQDMDSLNSFGNTETIPPYTLGSDAYPMGRLLRGSVASFHPDPVFSKMLESQAMQPPVYIDTSWLLVGHVDETLSFVKSSSPRGWALLVNDATLAKQMLIDQVDAGHGDAIMFPGQKWVDDNGNETSAAISITDVLADTEVMTESNMSAARVDSQLQIIKAATGLTEAEIIHVPYLHQPSFGASLAYQPGTVNGLSMKEDTFAPPDPHGPIINGKDIFKVQLEDALHAVGVNVVWVEDWDLYHRLAGEVHCGTNSLREVGDAKWWVSGR